MNVSTPALMQRSAGAVEIGARAHAGATALQVLGQSGCLRACFPRRHGAPLEAVIVNTSGGIADGDRLRIDTTAGENAEITITTPSAEKIYRARPGAAPARMNVTLHLEAGARLDFIPQETILFEGCALDRTLQIDLHPQARYLGLESLIFGRQDSGETLTRLRLHDTIQIRRAGRLVLHDQIRLQGDVAALLDQPATSRHARAVATCVLVSPDAAALLDATRDALAATDAESGASSWDGMLVVRLLAGDAQALRRAIVAALSVLRQKPLPRVWGS